VTTTAADLRETPRGLAAGFALLAALTWGLIVLGALVRAHGAGLACPDWPLCFGQAIPAFDLKVAFEWGHRLLAGSVSLCFLGLGALTLRRPVARRAVGLHLAIAAGLLCVQILLGALTVWRLLAAWTVTAHLLTGNAFAATLALTALRLWREAHPPRAEKAVPAGLIRGLRGAAALLAVQLALGGLVSSTYAGLACPEWPTCADGVWLPTWEGARGLHVAHRLGAYALVAVLAACAWLGRGVPRVGALARLAFGVSLLQVAVGVANVLLRIPVEVTGLHSALAAALVLLLALGLGECRALRRRSTMPDAPRDPTAAAGRRAPTGPLEA
jgi:heme A synthase